LRHSPHITAILSLGCSFRRNPVEKAAASPYNQTIGVIENRSQFHGPRFWASMMPELVPLTVLRCGQIAEIGQLLGKPEHVRRLQELGLRAGVRLEMIRRGAPCIIRVEGSKLCFRDDDSLRVMVRTRKTA
jgi:ferrous iron transport protein A